MTEAAGDPYPTLIISPFERFPVPGQCPQCGKPLIGWVEAWATDSGMPYAEGVHVACETDQEQHDPEHHYSEREWAAITSESVRWVRENVRVVDLSPAAAETECLEDPNPE